MTFPIFIFPGFPVSVGTLITGTGGGGGGGGEAIKCENQGSETFCKHPHQDRVKLFAPSLLQSGNFLRKPPLLEAGTAGPAVSIGRYQRRGVCLFVLTAAARS